MKPRHHLYLDDELTAQLDALSSVPGSSKSAIVADALRQYLRHKGGTDQDEALKSRLDRLSRHHARLEHDIRVLLETLMVFVRYHMLFTAHMPDPDNAAQTIAKERFEQFTARVARGLAAATRNATEAKAQAREPHQPKHEARKLRQAMSSEPHKLAYRIDEAVKATGLGRTFLYERIASGELKSVKVGGRRLILREELERFLNRQG